MRTTLSHFTLQLKLRKMRAGKDVWRLGVYLNGDITYIDHNNLKGIASTVICTADDGSAVSAAGISGVGFSLLEVPDEEKELLAEMSSDSCIKFILDAAGVGAPDFYTVPYIDVFAFDDTGGRYAAVGEALERDSGVIYIAADMSGYKTGMNFAEFIERFSEISGTYAEFVNKLKATNHKVNIGVCGNIEEASKHFRIIR